jgi:hypothetical protein
MNETDPVMSDEVLTVQAMDGQYLIESSGRHDDPWPQPWHALFTGEETWTAVLTGTRYGPVAVRVQQYSARPTTVDQGWDMIGERDMWCNHGGFVIHDLYSNSPRHHIDTPPGAYRLRVHVRGRAAAATASNQTNPVEQHLIQLWPVTDDAEPDLVTEPDEFPVNYI